MTALPDWMVLPPEGLTAESYEVLPEDICRSIEIVGGAILVNAAPRRPHQKIVRRLSYALRTRLTSPPSTRPRGSRTSGVWRTRLTTYAG